MKTRSLSFLVSDAIGTVSAELLVPEKSKCIMTLAHGAGAGMQHAFMVDLAHALATERIATLRFNFPFTENKKKRPDTPVVAHQAIAAAIAKAHDLLPALPLFVSGKSFGGRMSSQYVSTHPDAGVNGIVFYGFPLHPSGKPSTDRAAHLQDVKQPMLFLQGTRDELAIWELIEPVCSALPQAKLVKIEGADHSFKAGKQNLVPLLAKTTAEWVESVVNG